MDGVLKTYGWGIENVWMGYWKRMDGVLKTYGWGYWKRMDGGGHFLTLSTTIFIIKL